MGDCRGTGRAVFYTPAHEPDSLRQELRSASSTASASVNVVFTLSEIYHEESGHGGKDKPLQRFIRVKVRQMLGYRRNIIMQ